MSAKTGSATRRGWPRALVILGGLVLIAAALAKIFVPAVKSSLFGTLDHAMPWLAWATTAVELLLGLWLISGWRNGGAAVGALLLFSIFSGVIVHDMLQHHPQPCGCFGAAWQQAHEPAAIERRLAVGLTCDLAAIAALVVVLAAGGPSGKGAEKA